MIFTIACLLAAILAACGLALIYAAELRGYMGEAQQARIYDYPAIVPHLRAGRLDRALHAFATIGE